MGKSIYLPTDDKYFYVRNVPRELHRRVAAAAKRDKRSVQLWLVLHLDKTVPKIDNEKTP